MTKELFVESIKAIEKQYKFNKKVSKYLSKAFPTAFSADFMPDNHFISEALIKVLQIEMQDYNKDSWIDYFCFELDFGKKYKPGMVIEPNGQRIDFSTAGKVWEYLNKRKRD